MISVYDTTLRDGAQTSGVSFSLLDKLKIIKNLVDHLSIPFIELYPFSNPKDKELIAEIKTNHPQYLPFLTAFGSTRKVQNAPEKDDNLLAIVNSGLKYTAIFGKSWDFQLQFIHATPEQNFQMIEDSCAFLKQNGLTVFFDAEHFFDGYKADRNFAIKSLLAAERGGADALILCDTNGGFLPHQVSEIVQDVIKQTTKPLGIHCHNDSGMAEANSLAALNVCLAHNRPCQIQGTMNGLGERAGNTNLITILPILTLKMKLDVIPHQKLRNLTSISNLLFELANMVPPINMPFVGYNAFSHKGGMHIAAVEKNYAAYEHIDPDLVGNHRRVIISEMSGKSAIMHKIKDFNIQLNKDDPIIEEILKVVKRKETHGYTYEGADASLEILIRGIIADKTQAATYYRRLYFDVEYFRVITDVRNVFTEEKLMIFTDANIKMLVTGKNEFHTAADGNGPVNAIDSALRKALIHFYPILEEIELVDFKVRIANAVESESGTASRVRVLVETKDRDGQTWGTIGSHVNIIIAAFVAIIDSYVYKLMKSKTPPAVNGHNGCTNEIHSDSGHLK